MATILTVDDDPDVLDVIRRILRADGHEVEATTSSREALEWLGRRSYDVIVSSLEMPGMTGVELCEAAAARVPELMGRFIFMTGSMPAADARALVAPTRGRILRKPFDITLVRAEVRRALDGGRPFPVDGAGRVERLLQKLQDGLLARDGLEKTWYGNGRGANCDGCEESITGGDVEVEADFPEQATLRFHSSCFDRWRAARRTASS
jgi:CheY-like chemotaxis protein